MSDRLVEVAVAAAFNPALHPRDRLGRFRHALNVALSSTPRARRQQRADEFRAAFARRAEERKRSLGGEHGNVMRMLVDLERKLPQVFADAGVVYSEGIKPQATKKADVRGTIYEHLRRKKVAFAGDTVDRILYGGGGSSRYFFETLTPKLTRVKFGHVTTMKLSGIANYPDDGRRFEVDVIYTSPIGKPGQPMKWNVLVKAKSELPYE